MSMLSELVKELRKYAKGFKNSSYGREIVGTEKLLIQAADTIEELSAKVAKQSMERSSQYYGGGWIPCSERLPEEPFGCIVTVQDTGPVTGTDYECILPYFVGYDGEQWNDSDGEQIPVEVIAWQPLPPAFEPKED